MKKKDIVENDKTKIASVISELDQKKNEALQTAWKRVNKVHTHTTEAQTYYIIHNMTAHKRMARSKHMHTCKRSECYGFVLLFPILLASSKGLWLHLLHSPPRCHSQVGAT